MNTVWLLHTSCDSGDDYTLHNTEDEAFDALYGYVEQFWDGEMPFDQPLLRDRDEAIRAYFDAVDDEVANVTEVALPVDTAAKV